MERSLMHHGVKGQIWGVRRFQNEDGSRTTVGREHENALKRRNRAMSIKSNDGSMEYFETSPVRKSSPDDIAMEEESSNSKPSAKVFKQDIGEYFEVNAKKNNSVKGTISIGASTVSKFKSVDTYYKPLYSNAKIIGSGKKIADFLLHK